MKGPRRKIQYIFFLLLSSRKLFHFFLFCSFWSVYRMTTVQYVNPSIKVLYYCEMSRFDPLTGPGFNINGWVSDTQNSSECTLTNVHLVLVHQKLVNWRDKRYSDDQKLEPGCPARWKLKRKYRLGLYGRCGRGQARSDNLSTRMWSSWNNRNGQEEFDIRLALVIRWLN